MLYAVVNCLAPVSSITIKDKLTLYRVFINFGFVLATILSPTLITQCPDCAVRPRWLWWNSKHFYRTNQAAPFAGAAGQIESGTADSHQSIHSQSSAVLSQ
jgi:hypothetical protein